MDYARQFATAPGMIYGALLIAFTLMLLVVGMREWRSTYGASQSN